MNMRVYVYLCGFKKVEQVFARHYTSNIATCKLIDIVEHHVVKEKLPREYWDKLVEDGEILVYEPEIISRFVENGCRSNCYLRLIVRS